MVDEVRRHVGGVVAVQLEELVVVPVGDGFADCEGVGDLGVFAVRGGKVLEEVVNICGCGLRALAKGSVGLDRWQPVYSTSSVKRVEAIEHSVCLEFVLVSGIFDFFVQVLELRLALVKLPEVALSSRSPSLAVHRKNGHVSQQTFSKAILAWVS